MSRPTLTLSRGVYDAIVAHAREGTPKEVCGVLAGERGPETEAVASHRTANVADRPRVEYTIDPGEQFAVMERVEDDGREVVGFYHSHPAGPFHPSGTDIQRATWEGYSYVIVVLAAETPYVGSWRWTGEAFEQEVVRVA